MPNRFRLLTVESHGAGGSGTLEASSFWYLSQLILSSSPYRGAPSAEKHTAQRSTLQVKEQRWAGLLPKEVMSCLQSRPGVGKAPRCSSLRAAS